jgi:GntR family transcriptional regulator
MLELLRLDKRRGAPPLYGQLAEQIRLLIERGQLRPGDQLPSENEVTAHLEVSRATVVKAFEELEASGLVVREQGRGTFVSSAPLERRLPELTGFTEHIQSLGLRPGQRLLSYERVTAHDGDVVLASFPPGLPLVVVTRLRLVDGQPAGLHRVAIPAEVADAIGFTEKALEAPDASLYALMSAGGVQLHAAEEALRSVNATDEEAAILHTTPGAALIEVTRRSRDARNRLVEVVQARYLGSLYVYRIDLARPTFSAEPLDRSAHEGTSAYDRRPYSRGLDPR